MKGEAMSCVFFFLISATAVSPFSMNPGAFDDVLLREMVAKMGNDLVDYNEEPQPQRMPVGIIARGGMPATPSPLLDYDQFAPGPSLRDQEYLSHSSLFGNRLHQYDGNEGMQRFKPESGAKSSDLKADGVLPAYCNPPNPCPIGYTSKDGCIEDFENSAAFSRAYQAEQECMCDTEHMFNCPDSTRESEITAISRSIQNQGPIDDTFNKLMEELNLGGERVVAKKFHAKKSMNPYLQGERLPIHAKKGGMW